MHFPYETYHQFSSSIKVHQNTNIWIWSTSLLIPIILTYNQESYHRESYNHRSYDKGSYNRGSNVQGSYDKGSYNQGFYQHESYNQ